MDFWLKVWTSKSLSFLKAVTSLYTLVFYVASELLGDILIQDIW